MPVSAHMERFLDLTFLLVSLDEAQVIGCWCPDEVVKQELLLLNTQGRVFVA